MKEEKIHGPYLIRNPKSTNYGRKQVIIHYEDGSRRTMLLSRHLMEKKLGRRLLPEEHVDHINRDKTDDRIENLQILDSSSHASKDSIRVGLVEITCVLCKSKAMKKARYLAHNAKQGKAGPFCSRSCAGKYGRQIQQRAVEKLPVQKGCSVSERDYYYED